MQKLTATILVGFFRLLSLCPVGLLHWLGKGLGELLWLLNTRSKKVTEENLSICFPHMTAAERQRLAKASLWHLAMTALELGPIWFLSLDKLFAKISHIEGEALVKEARTQGGVIVLAPHIGAWELLGLYLAANYPLTSLYQPPDHPALHQLMIKARARSGASLAPTNARGVKTLLQTLKRGEMVGILPDQVPPKEGGDYADFFAMPALTTTLVKNLAARTGAKVLTAAAYRDTKTGTFRLVFASPPEAIYSKDNSRSLTAMNESVEQCVLLAPEQYQWEYKRFKKQPAGQKQFYR